MCWKRYESEGTQMKGGSVRSLWKTGLERISCHNFVLWDGYAYFSNWFYNGFFRTEIQTGETWFLGYFEGEDLSEINLHWDTLLWGGRIYFLPKRGRHMHAYSLSDGTMERAEIRGGSEAFFRIGEVILGDGWVALFPEEKGHPARKVDLETLAVADLNQQEGLQGERHIQRGDRDSFPASILLADYHIKNAGGVSWKLLSDGGWYGFLPTGCQLLRYSERARELHAVPLTVVNKEELKRHLEKVKESLLQSFCGEDCMGLSVFLEEVTGRMPGAGDAAGCSIGGAVWKHLSDGGRRVGRQRKDHRYSAGL